MTGVWTLADQAELDVLVYELASEFFDHLPRCDARTCPHLGPALNDVLEWKQARELRSTAARLRALEDVREWRAA